MLQQGSLDAVMPYSCSGAARNTSAPAVILWCRAVCIVPAQRAAAGLGTVEDLKALRIATTLVIPAARSLMRPCRLGSCACSRVAGKHRLTFAEPGPCGRLCAGPCGGLCHVAPHVLTGRACGHQPSPAYSQSRVAAPAVSQERSPGRSIACGVQCRFTSADRGVIAAIAGAFKFARPCCGSERAL